MRILGIAASSRKWGNSECSVKMILNAARDAGADTEFYRLDEFELLHCTGCLKCLKSCPVGGITGEKKKPHSIDQSRCEKCGICLEVCKYDAVTRK